MELRELIAKIKNFKNLIIGINDYTNPDSDHYLFEDEYFIYEGVHIFSKTDEEKVEFATTIMLDQINRELNIIDIELWELKIKKPNDYNIICNELIPDLISYLELFYSTFYPFGWEIEKHNHQNFITLNPDLEQNIQTENELTTQKDKVALLKELGIIDFLQDRYPYLKKNGQRTTKLLMQFLDIPYTSLQPIINELFNESTSNKNYPKLTPKVLSVVNKYTLEK